MVQHVGEDFDDFVVAVRPVLLRLGSRMGLPAAEAEDVACEALARAYVRWAKVADLPYRQAWVLRVAANVAVDQVRHRPLAVLEQQPVQFEEPLVQRFVVEAALRSLPRRQREAVVLRYLADQTVEQVAVTMRTTPNTVKKHLSRGMARLRDPLVLRPQETQ